MPEELSLSTVIGALNNLGYSEIMRDGDLVALDVEGLGAGYPIVLDVSREIVLQRDLIDQLENAGVDLNAFYATLEAMG